MSIRKILITCTFIIYTSISIVAYAADKNVIYVYQDEGVSQESFIQTTSTLENFLNKKYVIKTINAQEVINSLWDKDAALFVMPGGADLPYIKKLNGLGNQKIKQYVVNGGSFLGICAGAYYASSYVEFDKKGPLEVIGGRELQFFQGKSIGPILAPYDYKTENGSRAAEIFTNFKEVPKTTVYYNGGGFFENAEKFSNTKIIANYKNNLPAIISINYGNGRVLLSGVHFEYDPALLNPNDDHMQKIIKALNKDDSSREVLFYKLFQILGVL